MNVEGAELWREASRTSGRRLCRIKRDRVSQMSPPSYDAETSDDVMLYVTLRAGLTDVLVCESVSSLAYISLVMV